MGRAHDAVDVVFSAAGNGADDGGGGGVLDFEAVAGVRGFQATADYDLARQATRFGKRLGCTSCCLTGRPQNGRLRVLMTQHRCLMAQAAPSNPE